MKRIEIYFYTDEFDEGHQKAVLFDILSSTLLNYKILWKDRSSDSKILFDIEDLNKQTLNLTLLFAYKSTQETFTSAINQLKMAIHQEKVKNLINKAQNYYKQDTFAQRSLFEFVVYIIKIVLVEQILTIQKLIDLLQMFFNQYYLNFKTNTKILNLEKLLNKINNEYKKYQSFKTTDKVILQAIIDSLIVDFSLFN
ncbi:hypothetical protein [Mycoplasmopsis iners]|uniref:hypothetical protein n=1 Tax=Mycoplasmopsis iners TaxID=76630 RepID=UPI0004977879|nr:hypothetical protein [Mycoplasmopsis iners]